MLTRKHPDLTDEQWALIGTFDEDVLRPWITRQADEHGEQHGHCPLHDDENASASFNFGRYVWHCFAGCDSGNIGALIHRIALGDTVGDPPNRVRLAKPTEKAPLPSVGTVEGWHSRLLNDPDAARARAYLTDVRGITERTWKEHLLGWDGDAITFPVFDADGAVVNVRRRRPGPRQKMLGRKGHGTRHLYPAASELPIDGRVFIVEGELDALVLREHGFPAFTCIGGAGRLPDVIADHAEAFEALDVVVWTDADAAGRKAAEGVDATLMAHECEARVISPQGAPEGFDVSDAWRAWGRGFAERVELMLGQPTVDDAFERDVATALARLRVTEEARSRFRLEEARRQGSAPPELDEIPDAVEWLAEPDDEPVWRLDRLIQAGHNALLGGKDKAGKTTLAVDLVVALTQRESFWLDEFQVTPPDGKVGWINCEMTDRQFRRWLVAAGVDGRRLAVWPGRGNVPNLLDPAWWSRIEAWIHREGITFLIVDSLTEIVAAAGLDEDREGVEVLVALNRYRQTTNLSELLVLAHFGHNGERVRGTSKFGGWVDAKLHLYAKQAGDLTHRYLEATGRDTNVPEGEIVKAGTGRLMFQPGMSRAASKKATEQQRDAEAEELRALVQRIVTEDPGISSTALRNATNAAWREDHDEGVGNRKVDQARDALVDAGAVRVEGEGRGTGKPTRHYPVAEPEGDA